MDETVGGVVFVMLLIQVMSMYDSAKRLDQLERVIAIQMKAAEILSKSIYTQLDDQKSYRIKSSKEQSDQFTAIDQKIIHQFALITDLTKQEYDDRSYQNDVHFRELLHQLLSRTAQRVTRHELNTWTRELQEQFPNARIPFMPEIDAPKDAPSDMWHLPIEIQRPVMHPPMLK